MKKLLVFLVVASISIVIDAGKVNSAVSLEGSPRGVSALIIQDGPNDVGNGLTYFESGPWEAEVSAQNNIHTEYWEMETSAWMDSNLSYSGGVINLDATGGTSLTWTDFVDPDHWLHSQDYGGEAQSSQVLYIHADAGDTWTFVMNHINDVFDDQYNGFYIQIIGSDENGTYIECYEYQWYDGRSLSGTFSYSGTYIIQLVCSQWYRDNQALVSSLSHPSYSYDFSLEISSSGPFDSDGDGIPDDQDACPLEDSTGFDADGDGCIDTPDGLGDNISTLVGEGIIDASVENSLLSKVNNAEKSSAKDNICAAVNQLEALKNQVEAQRGKKISDDAADIIIAYTDNIIAQFLTQLPPGESC